MNQKTNDLKVKLYSNLRIIIIRKLIETSELDKLDLIEKIEEISNTNRRLDLIFEYYELFEEEIDFELI